MEGRLFDRIATMIGARASRRAALVALAGAGLGSALAAGADEAAASCRKDKQCGLCKRCKNGKCKKQTTGAACAANGGECQGKHCVCPADTWLCSPAPTCCDNGQSCFVNVYGGAGCGTCPDVADVCSDVIPQCGQFGSDAADVCGCVASDEGATVCSSGFYQCIECATDQDCSDALEAPALCLSAPSACSGCETPTICMVAFCDLPEAAVASKKNARLKRIPPSKIKPAVSSH
jgi:hypothetical protein